MKVKKWKNDVTYATTSAEWDAKEDWRYGCTYDSPSQLRSSIEFIVKSNAWKDEYVRHYFNTINALERKKERY